MHTVDFTKANEVQQLFGRLRSTCEGKQFSDVPERANPHLALVTADLSTQTKVEFPDMAPLYWGDSDSVNPAMYVRASMSIPGFFYPLRITGVPQGDEARARLVGPDHSRGHYLR